MITLSRPIAPLHFEPRDLPQAGRSRKVARLHRMDCSCAACAPIAAEASDNLSAQTKAKLAIAAAIVGSLIAFAIEPTGAFEALRATVAL